MIRRLVCRLVGHRWRQFAPRPDEPIAAVLGTFVMCARCGKLDR
jgi:hypothetical protein